MDPLHGMWPSFFFLFFWVCCTWLSLSVTSLPLWNQVDEVPSSGDQVISKVEWLTRVLGKTWNAPVPCLPPPGTSPGSRLHPCTRVLTTQPIQSLNDRCCCIGQEWNPSHSTYGIAERRLTLPHHHHNYPPQAVYQNGCLLHPHMSFLSCCNALRTPLERFLLVTTWAAWQTLTKWTSPPSGHTLLHSVPSLSHSPILFFSLLFPSFSHLTFIVTTLSLLKETWVWHWEGLLERA